MSIAIDKVFAAPRRLYELRKHAIQNSVKYDPQRFKIIPAGRRSGKTELAKRQLIKAALETVDTPWDDPRFFAAAPTRDQAKRIYWNDLKAMMPKSCLSGSPRETDLSFSTILGTEIHVLGMDKPERMEGSPWDGGILDEYANMKPEAWGEHVRPALSDRQGWCWLIGVPEGRNHYYRLYQYARSGIDPDWKAYWWPSSDILSPEEVESARRHLDPLVFDQEYNASFIDFEGRAYYCFLSESHTAPLQYNELAPLIFCFDFNVDPGVAAICQEQVLPGQFEAGVPLIGTGVIGEVWIPRNSNTPAVCRKLIDVWGKHRGIVKCYGDATGGARGSAKVAGSDWDLIKSFLRSHFSDRVTFHVSPSNPAERARLNAMNTRFRNGAKQIHMMVDPAKAPHVVEDLDGVRLLEGGSGEIDKAADPMLTHISDALGYYVAKEFPVLRPVYSVEPLPV